VKEAPKYGLVRAIAFILKLLAWVILVLCVAGAIFGVTLFSRPAPFPSSIAGTGTLVVSLLTGLFWFIPLYAFGSILSLLLNIEENTRAMASETSAYQTADRA